MNPEMKIAVQEMLHMYPEPKNVVQEMLLVVQQMLLAKLRKKSTLNKDMNRKEIPLCMMNKCMKKLDQKQVEVENQNPDCLHTQLCLLLKKIRHSEPSSGSTSIPGYLTIFNLNFNSCRLPWFRGSFWGAYFFGNRKPRVHRAQSTNAEFKTRILELSGIDLRNLKEIFEIALSGDSN